MRRRIPPPWNSPPGCLGEIWYWTPFGLIIIAGVVVTGVVGSCA